MRKRLSLLLLLGLWACQKDKHRSGPATSPDFDKAMGFIDRQNDSAYYYLNKVANTAKDSLLVGRAYNNMAEILTDAGDYFGSQELVTNSLKFLNEGKSDDFHCLTADYNELGMTSLKLKHYEAAIGYYEQAIRFTALPEERAIIRNNQGNVYQDQKKYPQALRSYEAALGLTVKDDKTYARILTNRAYTQWLQTPEYNAVPVMMKALGIRRKIGDLWGQNSSYLHLSDYYMPARPDSALFYANALYQSALRINSPNDKLVALQKLIRLAPLQQVRSYFWAYQHLADSIETAHSAARDQFALIRYESEKNKTNNLILQNRVIKQRVILYSALVVFAALFLFARRWYQKRRQQQILETREAVKASQRKASKTVHDALGNDIYRILKNVQNEAKLNRAWLVENIDSVYKRARNLSYEINIPTDERFPEHLSTLLQSFGTDAVRVVLVGNKVSFWQYIDATVKLELHYIVQELMVNMQKHSQAANVIVKFELEGTEGRITYFDDGVGIPPGTPHQNGLTNTGSRIKAINGAVIFDSHAGKGTEIQLTFPIA